jgi:hypothetical protein
LEPSGDTDNQLWRKSLERLNDVGTDPAIPPRIGDTTNKLLQKVLTQLANDAVFLGATDEASLRPQPGDTDSALLRKILTWVGGTPQPGDTFNALLRKYLTGLNLGGNPI